MVIRLGREEDAEEIRRICCENHISWAKDIENQGCTTDIYSIPTLQSILRNQKTIVSTEKSKVTGYALTLDNITHKEIFGKTIQDSFQAYEVPIDANALRFLQACLDPQAGQRPVYMHMLTEIEKIEKNGKYARTYGEILKSNKRSQRVHEKLKGYMQIASRIYNSNDFLCCEEMVKKLPIQNMEPTGEILLYEKKL